MTSFKILSKLGLCTFGQRGGSITLVKPFDPQVVPPLTARIAVLFRLPPEKVCALMNTRTVNDDFEPSAFDDLFHRLSPKITAFWNAEDAMRRDDKAGVPVPIADAAVSVGSLASAPIAHGAASVWRASRRRRRARLASGFGIKLTFPLVQFRSSFLDLHSALHFSYLIRFSEV